MLNIVRTTGTLVVGAGLVLLAGCAEQTDDDAAEPLSAYLGYSPLANEHQTTVALAESNTLSEEETRRQRATEDLIATCMRDQGFEYVPWYADDPKRADERTPLSVEAAMDPAEFAKQYGYGQSTIRTTLAVDPNTAIRDTLTPAGQRSYDDALWSDGGCHDQADQAVNSDADAERLRVEQEFADLTDDINRLRQRLNDDPRMRDALTLWSDCMADSGYPGLDQTVDARNLVAERMGVPDPGQVDPAKLPEVQAFERAVAVADFTCRREHVEPVRAEVAARLEKQFVAEHRAELERFRERAGDLGILLGGST